MSTTNVHQEIRGFLVETFLFGRNEELTDDAPLLDTVIDSHGVVEFVVFLQDRRRQVQERVAGRGRIRTDGSDRRHGVLRRHGINFCESLVGRDRVNIVYDT